MRVIAEAGLAGVVRQCPRSAAKTVRRRAAFGVVRAYRSPPCAMPDDAPHDASSPEATDDAAQDLRPTYRRAYEAALRVAKDLLGKRFRLVKLARNAYGKTLDEEDAMSAVKRDLLALARLVRAWAQRDYRQVSRKTILAIVGGVIYFVSPIDAIPDFIPVAGLADDVAVIAAVVRAVRGDLDRFRAWEKEQGAASVLENPVSRDVPSDVLPSGDGAPPSTDS
jgi:uncharacterized membrane protein YkvA (DUF1232 family)